MKISTKFILVALAGVAPFVASAQANPVSVRPMIAVAANQGELPIAPYKAAASPAPTTAQAQVGAGNVTGGQKVDQFTIELRDINLANAVTRWANQSGWRVRWDAEVNFLVDAPNIYTGTFEQALESLLSTPGVSQGAYPLEVCFYTNNPPLARITRRGDQNKECN